MQSVDSKKCKKKLSAPFCSIGERGQKPRENVKNFLRVKGAHLITALTSLASCRDSETIKRDLSFLSIFSYLLKTLVNFVDIVSRLGNNQARLVVSLTANDVAVVAVVAVVDFVDIVSRLGNNQASSSETCLFLLS